MEKVMEKNALLELLANQNNLLQSLVDELKKHNTLEQNKQEIKLLKIPDIQKRTTWGYNTCRDLFKRKDFPRKYNRKSVCCRRTSI